MEGMHEKAMRGQIEKCDNVVFLEHPVCLGM